jgi:primosomal protein N' (replication factor Y)
VLADVAFDLRLGRSFTYRVPEGLTVVPGQRVLAPLARRDRVGVIIALRDGDDASLKPLARAVEPLAVLSRAMLELARWAAEESASPLGPTVAAMLPPLLRRGRPEAVAPPPEPRPGTAAPGELWMDGDREDRLVERLEPGPALVVAPDVESAARWARRLDAARLDSGVPGAERRAAWFAAAAGRARVVVGTRSSLLVPLPPAATIALLDEHDAAHKPPGAPRLHSRDLLQRRAVIEGSALVLCSATPSVETWWRSESGGLRRLPVTRQPWPEIVTVDGRVILRTHPLTLPLTRAIEDAARRGRPAALIVMGEASALGCDECGAVMRCPACTVAFGASRTTRTLRCRLCARSEPLPATCPGCGGHRLSSVGWGGERVEASVRRRFPGLSVARLGPPGKAVGAETARTQVLIGSPALLRGQAPGTLGCVGFIVLDGLLRVPDFRGGERAFAALWAAAETVGPRGRVVVQTLHAEHHAIRAAVAQDRDTFYREELGFRRDLGYPPFRRLCSIAVRGRSDAQARAQTSDCAAALRGIQGLEVYPPSRRPGPRPVWTFVVKGPDSLPRLLAEPLSPFLEGRGSRGVVEVEMDPVSWW